MHTIRISGEELDRVITVAIAQGVDCVKGWAYFVHVDHDGSITMGGPHPVDRRSFDTPLNICCDPVMGVHYDANGEVSVAETDREAILSHTPERYLEPIRQRSLEQAAKLGIKLVLE